MRARGEGVGGADDLRHVVVAHKFNFFNFFIFSFFHFFHFFLERGTFLKGTFFYDSTLF